MKYSITYLSGDEQLDDNCGMLRRLLDRWRFDELRKLIWFIWTLRVGQRDKFIRKVLPLWVAINDLVNIERKDDRRILASLCSLSAYVDVLDKETTDLIIRGAPYVEMEHDSYILIEHLKRLVDAYPEQVGDIFSVMLDEFAPTYKQEHVEHILTVLYEHGGELRQKANKIFEKYLERGTEFAVQLRARLVN
jgi:hypothetical protein